MKKFFSLVLALVMALSLTTVAWGADGGTYSVADGDITIAVDANGVQTVTVGSNAAVEDAAPVITGTDAAKVITVTTAAGQTANFTIKDLTAKRIVIKDSSATITLEGANVIGGSSYGYDPAIYVTSGTLTINGTGSLTAQSNYAAAIGSDQTDDMTGTINIVSGTITAKSGYGAAIGAGQQGEMTGTINITGGTVNATGSFGAAIGGGQQGDLSGTISISDGTVETKSTYGAAIGGSQQGDLTSNAKINISGGTVSATSDSGAGIGVGGGYVSASETGTELAGEINISGGTVTATSKNGAGIGAGGGNVDAATTGSTISGTINISAGTVEASSTNGAGIGTGGGNVVSGGSVQPSAPAVTEITGTINVSGGNVTASSTNANAVGGGSYGEVASSANVSLSTGDYSGGDVEDYVAPGSTVVSNGNTVVKNNDGSVAVNPVAQIGNTKYTTVADAIAAAGANDVIVLLDAGATIPAGYSVVNGKVVANSSITGNSNTLDVDNLTAYDALGNEISTTDLASITKYAVSTSTTTVNGKTTTKVVPAYYLTTDTSGFSATYVECDKSCATLMFKFKGGSSVYVRLMDVPAAFDSTPVTLYTAPLKATCDKVGQDNDVYVIVDGKYYATDPTVVDGAEKYALLSNGKMVVYYGEATAKPHNWAQATKNTYDAKTGAITSVKCPDCKNPVTVYVVPGSFDGKTYVQITDANSVAYGYYYVAGAAANTITTPVVGGTTTGGTVTSAATFDAGIAMYVGMSVLAATGSAVVIGKKKD